jgi:hypothetical protein
MEKKATDKQIFYLKHILNQKGLQLSDVTQQSYDKLTHTDICQLFKQCDVPVSVDIRNLDYIIKQETDDYIIGEQYNVNTREKIMDIFAFKRLLVLDYDVKQNSSLTKDELLKMIKDKLKDQKYSFAIYETFGGYHVYCTSEEFDHRKNSTYSFMKSLGCDRFYIGFTKYVGFAVRLNKKYNRDEKFIERFVTRIHPELIDPKLQRLVEFKDTFTLKPIN